MNYLSAGIARSAGFVLLFCVSALLVSCSDAEPEGENVYDAVDSLFEAVKQGADGLQVVAEVDHSRLAAKEGEVMPPARVVLLSDPSINTAVLQQQPLAGLDLPYRALAYSDSGTPRVLATPAAFLQNRYGLEGPVLERYQSGVDSILENVPPNSVIAFDTATVGKMQGIRTINSNYGFDESIERLKTDILAEGDTIWFGEIDFQAEAKALGEELPRLTLLLFGAPGPGAKAMAAFPRMGLDAFCQKVLVYELPNGGINVYFNEMPELAQMHYSDSALPHKVINHRMGATLEGAVE